MPKNNLPRLIYASSEGSADMLYATKFPAPDAFLFLQHRGKRSIVLSDLEIDRGKKQAMVDEVVSLSTIEGSLEKRLKTKPPVEETIAHFLRQRRVRRAQVPADFPFGLAQQLAKRKITLSPVQGPFWGDREFKTAEEIKKIEKAIRITEIGLARGIEVLKAAEIRAKRRLRWAGLWLTSEILRGEIDSAIVRAGGLPINTIVTGGEQACDPHERGSGPLLANSLIILDVFPRDAKTGYHGDLTRTVVRGLANENQRKLWHTVLDGQSYALENIRVGESGNALQEKVTQMFTANGYPTEIRNGRWVGFFHGLGHGLGLEIHESPRIARTDFKRGQVLTVEPGLYFPGLGGVRHEDNGVVAETGFKVLSRFPKVLEV
ncbi:MAG: Xaa-Pro peptidase family protein [Chthoniobacterales bacterium]